MASLQQYPCHRKHGDYVVTIPLSSLEGISPVNSEFSSASLSVSDIALPNSEKEGKLLQRRGELPRPGDQLMMSILSLTRKLGE